MEDCDKGYKGNCCCNCMQLVKLIKHSHKTGQCKNLNRGWVCLMPLHENSPAELTTQHGMCEMHVRKKAA